MNNGQFFRAIEILKKYVKETGYNFNGNHDVFQVAVEHERISPEDLKELFSLGAHEDPNEPSHLEFYLSC